MMLQLDSAAEDFRGQGTSQATGCCHAVAEHLVLSGLIDEDVPEHVKVHHSLCVQVMLWQRRMVYCEVLLTAIMLCLRARMAVQLHRRSANQASCWMCASYDQSKGLLVNTACVV